jgi:hypothetical protein
MRWIKSRNRFLNEAKIKDIVLPRQAEEIKKKWSEKYLDYEEIEPTDKIKQGRWKLTEEDKIKVLSYFFGREDDPIDMGEIFKTFKDLDDKFVNILKKSIDISLFRDNKEKYEILLNEFDPKEPTIDQISIIFDPIFRKLNVNETISDELIKKDENGRPIRDEEGNMIRVKKEKGDPIFEKNLVNIKSFVESYNRCYDDKIDVDIFYDWSISNLVSLANENHNSKFKFDFEIFNKDLYLSINHKAQDILNMSISKFFSSCQHLYSGMYRENVLGNVFDPNSIPAFLVFDTPIFWDDDKISDFLPLSRMMIRSIEKIDDYDEDKILFHKSYPHRMKEIFDIMIEKYSDNKKNIDIQNLDKYIFTPDIDLKDNEISSPYMDDNISLEYIPYIGINAKVLHVSRNYDWSKVKISPKANLKEIVIENEDLPENLFKLNLNPDWIKFKFMKINDLTQFNLIITDSISFDKCSLVPDVINNWPSSDKIKKLQIISCDVDSINLSNFINLEELSLIYTLDGYEDVTEIIKNMKKLKKLVISGDLMSGGGKKHFNELKSKGIKVETIGPVI